MARDTADLVVVGAGTIGGWASYFAAREGLGRVVVLERGLVGQGASSRAAGIVRAQGGTPETVQLGRWSIAFYRRQRDEVGTDSGFRELGYLLLATSAADEREGRARVEMQRAAGLEVRWVDAREACRLNPTLSPDGHRGGSYCPTDGCIDPPRNVLAYSLALRAAGVELRERTPFLGITTRRGRGGALRVTGVETPAGRISTERVLLTGGPELRAVGRLVGARIPVGGARHQVCVSEPHPAFEVERLPMVFDLRAGLYWRLEEGGLLWGMSNPEERPGPARELDLAYLRRMRRRLARFVPVTAELGIRKAWAATIDYTPDHLPIIGPVLREDGRVLEGCFVASAGGHGMMWGPAVARAAADLATRGRTDVVDVTNLGMDRFDALGRSPVADRVALPFPADVEDREGRRGPPTPGAPGRSGCG
ncbi:MAG TPA: FAD-binding oxidoreductase [Actinomycetota bacterium]|nr:FAD-binding oxidoreductase [Actinomycetota bacterium]